MTNRGGYQQTAAGAFGAGEAQQRDVIGGFRYAIGEAERLGNTAAWVELADLRALLAALDAHAGRERALDATLVAIRPFFAERLADGIDSPGTRQTYEIELGIIDRALKGETP